MTGYGRESRPAVSVSYAWKAEKESDQLVKQLCDRMKDAGFNIISDMNLQIDDKTEELYKGIVTADFLIAVISRPYLESEKCLLHELVAAYLRAKYGSESFSSKVIFLVLDSAKPFLTDVSHSGPDHPLEPIIKFWQEKITNNESVGKDPSNDETTNRMSRLINENILNEVIEAIKSRIYLDGNERLGLDECEGIINLVKKRTKDWQPSPSRYIAGLRENSPIGLPRPGPSKPPKPARPASLSYSLMMLLEDSGEQDRFMLRPQLHVFQSKGSKTIGLGIAEWPEPLRQAQDRLQPCDQVMVTETGGVEEAVGLQMKEWLDVVERHIQDVPSVTRKNTTPPVMVELFVPSSLLHHDFGSSLRLPIMSASESAPRMWPLGSQHCFMLRSIERARNHFDRAEISGTLRKKWNSRNKKLLVVHICEDHRDEWHDDLLGKTQLDDVGFCVILPSLSTALDRRQKLLGTLVDSFLPLVVYWPVQTEVQEDAQLTFVQQLLGKSGSSPPSANAEDSKTLRHPDWCSIVPMTGRKSSLQILHIAKMRKDLFCDQHPGRRAIVLMDAPDRWPRPEWRRKLYL